MADTPAASPLRAAMTAAGLTTEQFADRLGVDAKTVRRWNQGRVPYPRHRIAISRTLDVPQHELWPDLPETATREQPGVDRAADAATDPVTGYPTPDHPGFPSLEDLIVPATSRIDISDHTLLPPLTGTESGSGQPTTQLADHALLELLIAKHRVGVQIRVLLGHIDRDLARFIDPPNIQLRVGNPVHTIHRADNQLLVGLGAVGIVSDPRPVLHVQRHTTDGLFDRLLDSYQTEWDDADPITTPEQLAAYLAETETDDDHEGQRVDEIPEADEAAGPEKPEVKPGSSPRRWPRRPPQESGGRHSDHMTRP